MYKIKSAGRSRKGDRRDTNCDFICNFEFTADNAEHGFYAVADGSLSTRNGERASEVVVKALSTDVRRASATDAELDVLINNANKALCQARNGLSPDEFFVSSLICGYLTNNSLHVATAGNGAAYLIQNKRIQRLTENQNITAIDDLGLEIEHTSKGLLGLSNQSCYFKKTDARLLSGDAVVFCSDGLAERLDSVSILETVTAANSPELAAAMLLDKAAERGASDDISVVVVCAMREDAHGTRFVQRINYPMAVRATKYAIALSLLALLAGFIHFFRMGDSFAPTPQATQAQLTTAEAQTDETEPWTPVVVPEGTVTEKPSLLINTVPAGASVSIDGIPISGVTPLRVTVDQKREAVLEFTMAGFLTKRTRVQVQGEGAEESVTVPLQTVPDHLGGLDVTCVPACDDLFIDGEQAAGVKRPFRSVRLNLTDGAHTIEALSGTSTRSRAVNVTENTLSTVDFTFDAATAPPVTPETLSPPPMPSPEPGPRPVKPGPRTPEVEVVKPSGGSGEISKTGPTDKTSQSAKPAFVTVHTTSAQGNLPGCRVMFFQGGHLVATGNSYASINVQPGSYLVKVSRDGYETYEAQKYVGSGSHTIKVFMQTR